MKTLITLLAACACLPGCIAQEIRDELHAANANLSAANPALGHTLFRLEQVGADIEQTNAQLAEVQASITQTNKQLADMHGTLVQTNRQLTEVQTALMRTDDHLVAVDGTLKRTNPTLVDVNAELARMRILNEVHRSIDQVNTALAPLTKSMGMISSAASVFGLGGGSEVDLLAQEDAASSAPAASPAVAGESAPKQDAPAEGAAAAAGTQKADLIVGTWLLVYPPTQTGGRNGNAVVISADGTFFEAEPGKPMATGKWTRTRRTLSFTRDATGPSAQKTVELVTLTARTLTLRLGDELLIYTRP